MTVDGKWGMYSQRGTDEVREREAERLEKKMDELERLQRDNLTSASLVNWQKWRAAEGKLRVTERDNDTLRQDLDTANRWIAHLEDEVRERQCHQSVGSVVKWAKYRQSAESRHLNQGRR
jgi:hypothetical protein